MIVYAFLITAIFIIVTSGLLRKIDQLEERHEDEKNWLRRWGSDAQEETVSVSKDLSARINQLEEKQRQFKQLQKAVRDGLVSSYYGEELEDE